MYDIMYDIIHEKIELNSPACMISRTYDIVGQWYQSTYHKLSCMISEMISSMISNMISRCLYPPLKTRCIERCRSLHIQVALCRFKCRMFKIGDGDLAPSSTRPGTSSASDASRPAMCDIVCPSQSLSLDVGPPTKLAPSSSLSGRVCTGGRSCVSTQAPLAQAPGCSSGSWTRCLQEFMCQMGIQTGFRVTLHYWQQLESNSTYCWIPTVGSPTEC